MADESEVSTIAEIDDSQPSFVLSVGGGGGREDALDVRLFVEGRGVLLAELGPPVCDRPREGRIQRPNTFFFSRVVYPPILHGPFSAAWKPIFQRR